MTFASRPVDLETGDPELKPASFTRLVLPFAWTKTPYGQSVDGPRFVEEISNATQDTVLRRYLARRKYFSPETSLVLFERATWLRVESEKWPAERARRTIHINEPRELRISPPRVVLFESKEQPTPAELSTGFLLVDVSFASDAALDDLLAINELLRYWREPFAGHREQPRSSPAVSHDQLAHVLGNGGEAAYCGGWQSILRIPVLERDGSSWQLVGADAAEGANAWLQDCTNSSSGWICYTDDRAFVYTCALTAGGSQAIGRHGEAPEESGEWVRLLNVDFPSTELATSFERGWASDRTYERWKHLGTLYGFSSHSAVMLGEPCIEMPTWQHFADMYFDQVLLLLYLRVTTFRFSAELSRISSRLRSERQRDAENARRRFAELRQTFAFFTNLYRFPLLSSQQQGIEMYTLARRSLDVEELFGEVQKEIESTHEFFELMTAAGQQRASNRLAWIATVATAAGISFTYLGLDRSKALVKSLQGWIDGWWLTSSVPDAWWLVAAGPAAAVLLIALGRDLWSQWAKRDSRTDPRTLTRRDR